MASKFGPTLKSAGGAAAKPATAAPAPVPAPAPEEAGFPAFPRINVGGVEHQASLEALRSQPGSLLTDVFTGNAEVDLDNFGRFFFDRDPTYFPIILNFYRTGAALGVPSGRGELEALRREAEFFKVDALLALLPSSIAGTKAAAPEGTPSGGAVFKKWLERQSEMNGELAGKLVNVVANALNEGATLGYNSITLTAYRPPETIGVVGLPAVKAPEWGITGHCYVWHPEFAGFFSAARGFPILHATRDYLLYVLKARGFTASTKFDEKGLVYDISAVEGSD